ncbi:Myb-like DNA-binding domain-containing protein [Penicillium ucsense]|uniref:Myb-like DNA-binding domain-containing protein n=1 Tax=Penicillium ucsense TaxID=2839758 RepID=A0A8J8W801_9EURO|nr:Myb-like DNA-binding domain-containing protein [Penicillium ucsense]KAF7736012.1 Myb-like DNA-binding domain-containing protein [Penicillium ucsense]
MEVPESPTSEFPIRPTTALKIRKKRSPKNGNLTPTITPVKNGAIEDSAPEDGQARPSKRKRVSQSGQRSKSKKSRRESEIESPSKIEAEELEIEETQDQVQDESGKKSKSRKASTSEGSPDPTSDSKSNDGQPKKARGPRIGGRNQQKVGFFVEDEIKALEQFKIRFCNTHGVQGRLFDAMIQHSERGGEEWPLPTQVQTKNEFWNEIYDLIPDRDRRSVYRFMRRHFQDTTQKAHVWTPEQDDELVRLHAHHGPKYALIAKILGRSDDDVTQRWKNRLQYRATKLTGAWSEAELVAFINSLEEYRKILIESSADPEKAGKDIWEMDLKSISWGSISNGMENTRTRQQCADKWRKIAKTIKTLRETVDPDADFDPSEAARRWQRYNGNPSRERSTAPKSEDLVNSDSEEEEGSRIPSSTPAHLPKSELTNEEEKLLPSQLDQAPVPEPSVSLSISEANGVPGAEQTSPKQINVFTEEFAAMEPATPFHEVSESVAAEKQRSREEKKEKKRRKKEEKERKKLETAAEIQAPHESDNDGDQGDDPSTPHKKKRKDKKHRKSEMNDAELVASSSKKPKKEKKTK